MAIEKVYDGIYEGWHTNEEALDYARGLVWCEIEAKEQKIYHSDLIETIDGIGVFYNYMADYYFFTDETGAIQV
tara:strand:- start:798 stop:1019 length:222 start_codon:yes stop_codon:yes gene_type:complete